MNTGIPNLSIEALFRARALARIAHQGQTDRLNDPLFDHLERVAQRTTTPYTRALAYLHDIVEDSTVTLTEIATFFDAPLARDVDALTRRTDETYARYIERIAQASAAAREVKLADLADHLRAPLRIPQSLERRYRRAQQALLAPPDPEPPPHSPTT